MAENGRPDPHSHAVAHVVGAHGLVCAATLTRSIGTMVAPELLTAGGKYSVNRQKLLTSGHGSCAVNFPVMPCVDSLHHQSYIDIGRFRSLLRRFWVRALSNFGEGQIRQGL